MLSVDLQGPKYVLLQMSKKDPGVSGLGLAVCRLGLGGGGRGSGGGRGIVVRMTARGPAVLAIHVSGLPRCMQDPHDSPSKPGREHFRP